MKRNIFMFTLGFLLLTFFMYCYKTDFNLYKIFITIKPTWITIKPIVIKIKPRGELWITIMMKNQESFLNLILS